MNKKGFLFSFFLIAFSFLFIGSVKAYTYSGVELDSEFFNKGWEVLEGKKMSSIAGSSSRVLHKDDFHYSICSTVSTNEGIQIKCAFLTDISFKKTSGNAIYYNTNTTKLYSYAPAFQYSIRNNTYLATWDFGTWFNNYDPTSFDLYDSSGNQVATKDFDFPPITNYSYTINFHLNGGEVFDTSDTMNPELKEQDFNVSLTSDELHDYITHLTFMKSNSEYIGLYYDSNFTESYSPTDTIDSDIDLYAKFESKIYNVNDIDYFEFKFDNFPLSETNIIFDYHFKTVTQDGQNETIQFSQPFGREYYTGCDDEGQNCSTDIKYKDNLFYDLDYINYDYSDSKSLIFNSSSEHITNSYSVVIPTETLRGTYLYIDFDSEQDYEMIIHYKSDVDSNNSYIRTIDLTGKYGAIFLPLYDNSSYVDVDSYYLTKFKVVGNVDIQVTDSREMTGYNILQLYSMNYCNNQYLEQSENDLSDESIYLDNSIPYSCDNTSGIFNFKIDNLTAGQTLRFLNHSYTELSDRTVTIDYDSRYFNYGILDTPYSTVEIEDPTTHEIETVGLSEFYQQLDETSINSSKNIFKSAFQRFVYPIKFLFKNVTKLYNNYLNSSMQHYFFIVFSLTLVILIFKIII